MGFTPSPKRHRFTDYVMWFLGLGQLWMMSTYNSASVKVINFNLFLKTYQVTD